MRRRITIFLIAILLVTANMGPVPIVPSSLDPIKAMGRVVTYGIIMLAFLGFVISTLVGRKAAIPGIVTKVYCCFYLFYAFKLAAYGHYGQASVVLGVAVIYTSIFGFYLPMLVRKGVFDITAVIVAIGLSNLILLALHLPLTMMPDQYTSQGRFFGLIYNPNVLSYSLALSSCCLAATLRPLRPSIRLIVLCAALAGSAYITTVTLSRGALIILALSMVINFYFFSRRAFKISLLATPATVFVGALYFKDTPVYATFFAGRGNTRNDIWGQQWSQFIEWPLFGEPWLNADVKFGENSYLGAAAAMGVFGVILVALIIAPLLLRLRRDGWGRSLMPYTLRTDFQIAASFIGLLALSCVLEGLILGIVGSVIFSILLIDAGRIGTIRAVKSAEIHRRDRPA